MQLRLRTTRWLGWFWPDATAKPPLELQNFGSDEFLICCKNGSPSRRDMKGIERSFPVRRRYGIGSLLDRASARRGSTSASKVCASVGRKASNHVLQTLLR
ncbi:hypothetical protein KC351_g18 [Hortaea werneckii]|nr:hypothetical protein KC351_g18 [Hortaea werneckii]